MERNLQKSKQGMKFEGWYLMLGGLLLLVAFLDVFIRHLPITTTIVYLLIGVVLGPVGFDLIGFDPVANSGFLERIRELGVIVSLFTAGMKLRVPITDGRWRLPISLAFLSMGITVGLVAVVGVFLLNLPLGAAVLLGAVLAPTDPVLASDVQLEHAGDRDRLRFSLTGEAGMNDGTAFPFVMLGLGLLGLHEIGDGAWRWWTIDLLWAVTGGLGIGAILGALTGKYIFALRSKHEETLGRDEFIALGLIGSSYGLAILLHAYGFLAVFAAGLALRQYELKISGLEETEDDPEEEVDDRDDLDDAGKTSVHVAGGVLGANEQLERILEVGIVLILGGMLSADTVSRDVIWFAPLLFFVIRPLSVLLGTFKSGATNLQRKLLSWFGIRGVGSIYYLMYAIQHGLPQELAERLSALTLSMVAISVFVHGISVSPIMERYNRSRGKPEKAR
jgi:NhaP-type Na+/H+ or K+/H+ antiporter